MADFIQLIIGQSEWNSFSGFWLPVGFKVIVAIMCGGIIGLERELKHKPAGLRTNILICLGSTLFTTLSVLVADSVAPGHPGDPARLAAQVVSGVGFLGGGMIMQSGGAVSGLNSAATVWVVAAIGVCIGLGFPITAAIFTVTVFCTLYFLSKIDNKVFGKLHSYETNIHMKTMDSACRAQIMEIFQVGDLEMTALNLNDNDAKCQIRAKYYASEARHLRIQAAIWSVPSVDRVDIKIH